MDNQNVVQSEIPILLTRQSSRLPIFLGLLVLLLLLASSYLAHQNIQLQKQIALLLSTPPPVYVEEGNENLFPETIIDQYVLYVMPEGWRQEGGEALTFLSPDYFIDNNGVTGMGIRISLDQDILGYKDPVTQFNNYKSGRVDNSVSDVKEVNIFPQRTLRYHESNKNEFYSTNNLTYYVIFGGYGWKISFETASLEEEKKYQKVIDQFLADLKFEIKNNSLPVKSAGLQTFTDSLGKTKYVLYKIADENGDAYYSYDIYLSSQSSLSSDAIKLFNGVQNIDGFHL
jgi:hypothetical protein